MGKKWVIWFLGTLVCVFFVLTLAGGAVKGRQIGCIAPGIKIGDRNLSGMTPAEAELCLMKQLPEVRLELVCLFPAELQETVKERVRRLMENKEGDAESGISDGLSIEVRENKIYVTTKESMADLVVEETLENVLACSKEVKVWEWLYAEVFEKPFVVRRVMPEFGWRERYFSEVLELCKELLEQETKEASLTWEDGNIIVTKGQRGFCVDKAATYAAAEQVFAEVIETLENRWADGVTVQLFVSGTVTAPKLTTEEAKQCDTKIAEFTTGYPGAGKGRVQNIIAGAAHLHGTVILPGEEFSTAAALMPFTEANGYTSGGTYIDGRLSESIGGGVCQLSTTLYNALLRTTLEVTSRYPHSFPVGYIPLGQDAAIAGDYKDLRFQNGTDSPILLLCETTGEEVRVTLYGPKEAARRNVTIESIITEETTEGVAVEVYRMEQAEGGAVIRELINRSRYGYLKSD